MPREGGERNGRDSGDGPGSENENSPLHAHSGRAAHQSSIDCPRPIDSKQACPAWQKNLAPSTDKAATRSQYVPDPQLPLRRCVSPLPGSMATSKAQAWGDGSSNEQQGCLCRSVAPGSQAPGKVRRDAFWAVATYLRGSQPAENSSLSGVCFISLPSAFHPSTLSAIDPLLPSPPTRHPPRVLATLSRPLRYPPALRFWRFLALKIANRKMILL